MAVFAYVKSIFVKSYELSFTLFKIMIPIIVVIKVLEELDVIRYLSLFLQPIMEFVGLPGAMGLVWATAILSNLYGGLVVFASLAADNPMSVAQVTVISSMMLFAHALPIEARIAQKVGIRLGFTLFLRIAMAIVFAWIMNHVYLIGGWLQQPVHLLWTPELSDPSLMHWFSNQLMNLLLIFIIVFVLVFTLDILQRAKIIDLLTRLLRPILHRLGIGKEAETITLVGLTLGLSYGGALLIKEVEQGHIPANDVLYSMSLLGLSHSLIEDTLLMMVISASLSGILFARVLFTLVVIALLVVLVKYVSEKQIDRFMIHSKLRQKIVH